MAKEETPEEAPVAKKKKGKLLIIILALVGVIVLAAVGVSVWLLTTAPDKSKKAQGHAGAAGNEGDEGQVDDHPPIYEKLDQFTVNLADQQSYLQTEIQLMVADTNVQEKLKAHMPEVSDAMIRILSSKTPEELNQPEGKTKLAEEVQDRLNEMLGIKQKSKGVKKVLFGAFIIQ